MQLSLLRKPSAWIPIVLSMIGLSMVLAHVAMYGIVREPDEGTPAHIFQLLMVAQIPLIGYFAAKWLPLVPEAALRVLALQAFAIVAAFAAVYWLT